MAATYYDHVKMFHVKQPSFPDAESGENLAQYILYINPTDQYIKGVHRRPQMFAHQFNLDQPLIDLRRRQFQRRQRPYYRNPMPFPCYKRRTRRTRPQTRRNLCQNLIHALTRHAGNAQP
jgi:hypothetical protein